MRTVTGVDADGASADDLSSIGTVARSFAWAWVAAGAMSAGSVLPLVPVGFVIAGTAWRRARRDVADSMIRRAAGVQMLIWYLLLGSLLLTAFGAGTAARIDSALCLAALAAHGSWVLGTWSRSRDAAMRRVGALEIGAFLLVVALVAAAVETLLDASRWGTDLPAWIGAVGLAGVVLLWLGYGKPSALLRVHAGVS